MSAVILEDFYRPWFSKDLSETHVQIVMKLSVILFGSLCVALVQIVEKLGTVLQVNTKNNLMDKYVKFECFF